MLVDGEPAWSASAGGATSDWVNDVAWDGTRAIAAGSHEGTFSNGSASRVSAGESDAFVTAWDRNGAPSFLIGFGGAGADSIGAIEPTASGDGLWIVGHFTGDVALGDHALTARGDLDGVIARIALP